MYTMYNVLARLIILLVVAFLFQFTPNAQAAGEYPTRPIELIFPYASGGSADLRVRALAPKMGEILGQPVVVINKPGASGTLAATLVAKAKPDGYTIGYITATNLFAPLQLEKIGYNPLTDFTYIAGSGVQPFAFLVRSDAPWKTIGEFIDYAKKNPGMIKYGSAGMNSASHLYGEMFGKVKNLKLVHVPFKGDQESSTALLGGHISMASLAAFAHYVRAGKLSVLVVFMENRMAAFPQIPTMTEIGFPYDTRAGDVMGHMGPKGLPPEILKKLENAVKQAVKTPEYAQLMEQLGSEIRFRDSEEFTKLIHEIYPQTAEMIRLIGLSKPNP